MVVRAGGTVDREAFGLRFDVPGVGKLVPRQLRLEIDVDVVRVWLHRRRCSAGRTHACRGVDATPSTR